MAERLVTVFGGSGFVGRHLVRKLVDQGWRVRVAVRDAEGAKFLKPLGDLGQVSCVTANVTNADSIRRAVAGADVVINLVGILYERGRRTYKAIHTDAAAAIARAAREAGASQFVQMSALGAAKDSPSAYARSKAEGEEQVRAAFPGATIFRPSVIFGPEDGFYNLFGALARAFPVLPYFTTDAPALRKGANGLPEIDFYGRGGMKLQPVYVGDVTSAIAATLTTADLRGKTYELGGPQVYSMREVLQQVAFETRRNRCVVPVPMIVAKIQALVLQFLPVPPLTPDMVRQMERDNVVTGTLPGLEAFGITPEHTSAHLPAYLERFRPLHRQIRRMGNKHT